MVRLVVVVLDVIVLSWYLMVLVEHLNRRVLDPEISDIRLRVLFVKLCTILKEVDRVVC